MNKYPNIKLESLTLSPGSLRETLAMRVGLRKRVVAFLAVFLRPGNLVVLPTTLAGASLLIPPGVTAEYFL